MQWCRKLQVPALAAGQSRLALQLHHAELRLIALQAQQCTPVLPLPAATVHAAAGPQAAFSSSAAAGGPAGEAATRHSSYLQETRLLHAGEPHSSSLAAAGSWSTFGAANWTGSMLGDSRAAQWHQHLFVKSAWDRSRITVTLDAAGPCQHRLSRSSSAAGDPSMLRTEQPSCDSVPTLAQPVSWWQRVRRSHTSQVLRAIMLASSLVGCVEPSFHQPSSC